MAIYKVASPANFMSRVNGKVTESVYGSRHCTGARKPDHVLGADTAFVAKYSLPARESPEGYLETIPELIVEIRSKNDGRAKIKEKILDYLNAGTRLVWLIDPQREIVESHRPNSPAKTHRKTATLTCPPIIPGFHLPLAELFRP
ncbi:MAG TPA: Uma2 family endonuclease [Lacipirellulaceae bacterium]|nr:Uma2 family endonuclease [Lacipirellulaceae bacterium]